MKPSLTIALFYLSLYIFSPPVFGQKGKDGNKTITTVNTIVNEFTALNANAVAGSNSITVANANLNLNGRFPGPLAAGDLIMIIQMQGATINGNANDSTWGAVTSYNNCGLYEFLEVSGVANNTTIGLSCPLKYDYTSSGKVQVIRVPRYLSLNINNGGVLTTSAWNGTTGGVLPVEVAGATVVNTGGSVNVTGLGFRGGDVNNVSNIPGSFVFSSLNVANGGEKGESIAGYQADYNAYGGRFSRGAPANGGGGGNSHNAGGGGGANAGIIINYTGTGNPNITNVTWINAWEKEYVKFSESTSSGGGKGGYTFALNNEDSRIVPPGDTLWGGDNRQNTGGKGGRPLDYSGGRLFLGGGGGAGDANNGNAGGAGAGGGIVYFLSYGTISGNGMIYANGGNGLNTTGIGIDAAGGAGGGGTAILNATGAITGIAIRANGGNGGNQIFLATTNPSESEGPGGGGGGGYIAISNGAISRTASGGVNGTTTASGVNEFPPNGATMGGAGFANEAITNNIFNLVTVNDTICSGNQAFLTAATTGNPPPNVIIYWYDAPSGGTLVGAGTSFTTPVLTQTTTYYLSTCPGLETAAVTAVVVPLPVAYFNLHNVCLGNATYFTDLSTSQLEPITSWEWNFGDGSSLNFSKNPIHIYKVPGTYIVTLKIKTNSNCIGSYTSTAEVFPVPVADFSVYPQPVTIFDPVVNFTDNSTGGDYWHWNFGDGTSVSGIQHPQHKYPSDKAKIYMAQLIVVNEFGCSDTAELPVEVVPEFAFYIPNSFTPNGDGVNDFFFGSGIGIVDYEMWIFDRWGMQIFYTSNISKTWDGIVQNGESNEIAQQDVYVWMVKLKDVFGKMHKYQGHVSLIR